jgi:hypothetical protein
MSALGNGGGCFVFGKKIKKKTCAGNQSGLW